MLPVRRDQVDECIDERRDELGLGECGGRFLAETQREMTNRSKARWSVGRNRSRLNLHCLPARRAAPPQRGRRESSEADPLLCLPASGHPRIA